VQLAGIVEELIYARMRACWRNLGQGAQRKERNRYYQGKNIQSFEHDRLQVEHIRGGQPGDIIQRLEEPMREIGA
jgi:hypothetical protein